MSTDNKIEEQGESMTLCRCAKPNFTLHLEDRPKDKANPMSLRCKWCGGLPKKEGGGGAHSSQR